VIGEPSRTVLLDTCTFLDLSIAPDKIAHGVRADLSDLSVRLLVSAATAWEIAIKTRHGRLAGGERLLSAWDQSLIDLEASPLAIDHDDAIRAGGLQWAHRDPFDRVLVAQAVRRNLPVATRDKVIIDARIVATIDTRKNDPLSIGR
jgi:PIN domain nuclease of toxin-antitoxin system